MTNEELEAVLAKTTAGTVTDPEIGPIDGTIQDAAYQVSRGIRPLVLLGHVKPDPITLLRAYNRLAYLGSSSYNKSIPVVMLRKDRTCADAGFAARKWVGESFKWVMDNAPQPHLDRLLGLMLGYSPDAIAENDEGQAGNLFPDTLTVMGESASNPLHDYLGCMGEKSPPQTEESPGHAHSSSDTSLIVGISDQC